MKVKTQHQAFTLIELLVVISVISVLAGLLLPSLTVSYQRAKSIHCFSNLRQLGLATHLYSDDDSRQSFSGKQYSEDQNLNWLLPYAGDALLFLCPMTKNSIRTNVSTSSITGESGLQDLMYLADNNLSPGMSYQGLGFTGVGVDTWEDLPVENGFHRVNGMRKNASNTLTYIKFHDAFNLKGIVPGPSRLWIILDNTLRGNLYYPDVYDNHGERGANVLFCDGHVEFVPRRTFVYLYELSEDENRTGIPLTW